MTVYGGSHDEEIGVIFEGAPKGFTVNKEDLYAFMKRSCDTYRNGTNDCSGRGVC